MSMANQTIRTPIKKAIGRSMGQVEHLKRANVDKCGHKKDANRPRRHIASRDLSAEMPCSCPHLSSLFRAIWEKSSRAAVLIDRPLGWNMSPEMRHLRMVGR